MSSLTRLVSCNVGGALHTHLIALTNLGIEYNKYFSCFLRGRIFITVFISFQHNEIDLINQDLKNLPPTMSSEFNSLQISSAKQATKFAVETCTEGVPCKMMIWLEAKQMQTGQILAGVASTHIYT
jgi:hypothetical protein